MERYGQTHPSGLSQLFLKRYLKKSQENFKISQENNKKSQENMKQYQENIKECQKNGEIWTNTSQWT